MHLNPRETEDSRHPNLLDNFLSDIEKHNPYISLAEELFRQIAVAALGLTERAGLCCELVERLEEMGDYEAARETMGEVWPGVGERPVLDGLDGPTAASVLLCSGMLTGRIGSATRLDGSQELAKNLIGESLTRFEELGLQERLAAAQVELAVCYWRQGALNEARVILEQVLHDLGDTESEVKAVALIRSAILERSARNFDAALRIHTEAAPLFERLNSHSLKGRFHLGHANLLLFLGEAENRPDYIDRALVELTAAGFHFEQAVHTRYRACVENNLGQLFLIIGRHDEAHEHLDRARALFKKLNDGALVAQVDEMRARVLLAEGRVAEAERLAGASVLVLENGGEQSLLAEALTTHGTALSRSERAQEALEALRRAVEVAREAGNAEQAGRAALTIIEELGGHLSGEELSDTYERAAEMLSDSQNMATLKRLCTCARRALSLLGRRDAPPDWEGFSLREAIRRYEGGLIEKALKDAGGQVTRAAQLLGIKYHNGLVAMLKGRHRNLLSERTPVQSRRRSIIKVREEQGQRVAQDERQGDAKRAISILHAEDNQVVAAAVKETLEMEGWRVETFVNGVVALGRLQSDAPFDALLFDNELPGMRGIEIIRRAREMPRHRHTPILMLSASECESEARAAGVDVFLRKPQDVLSLADTIKRLLAEVKES
jgi:two-component system chemotaxis response regulator CheY